MSHHTDFDVDAVTRMRRARENRQHRAAQLRRLEARRLGIPTGLVDAAPARQRVTELVELGWGWAAIAEMNGAGTSTSVMNIANGVHARCDVRHATLADLPLTVAPPAGLPDSAWVPMLGATRRLRALQAMGWSVPALTELLGRYAGHIAGAVHKRTSAGDWRTIDQIYRKHGLSDGPSRISRTRARNRGYVTALGWDDIDDPTERPSRRRDRYGRGVSDYDEVVVERILGGDLIPATRAEKCDVVARWEAATGRSLNDLERWTGWRPDRYHDREVAS